MLLRAVPLPLLFTLLLPALAAAQADRSPAPGAARFDARRVMVGPQTALRALVAGKAQGARLGARSLKRAAAADAALGRELHRLMPAGPAGIRSALITPKHVALVERQGVIQLYRRADVEALVGAGARLSGEKLRLGGRLGRKPLEVELGPNETVMLFRELPQQAQGQVASCDFHTSFALGQEDAMHPFGPAGKTVKLALPKRLLDAAIAGTSGAVGWNESIFQGMGIDVEAEVQIPSRDVDGLFH